MKQTYSIEELLALKETCWLAEDMAKLLELFTEEVSQAKEIELSFMGANYGTRFNKSSFQFSTVPMLFSPPLYNPQPYMFQQFSESPSMVSFDDYIGPFKSRFHKNQLNFKEKPRLYKGFEVIGKENHEFIDHLPPGSTIIRLEPGMEVPPGAIKISPYQLRNIKNEYQGVHESLPIQYPLSDYGTLSTKNSTMDSNLSAYSETSDNPVLPTIDEESQASTFSSCDSYSIQIQLPKM